jgi:hypothetical protein
MTRRPVIRNGLVARPARPAGPPAVPGPSPAVCTPRFGTLPVGGASLRVIAR